MNGCTCIARFLLRTPEQQAEFEAGLPPAERHRKPPTCTELMCTEPATHTAVLNGSHRYACDEHAQTFARENGLTSFRLTPDAQAALNSKYAPTPISIGVARETPKPPAPEEQGARRTRKKATK